jgi:hypothetical protein
MTYIERIFNITTQETTERELTPAEVKVIEAAKLQAEKFAIAEQKKADDKVILLAKLGITEDEAKLLLS